MFILTVTLSGQLTKHVATKRKRETNLHYRNRKRKRPFPTNLPCLLKKNLHFGIHCFRLSQFSRYFLKQYMINKKAQRWGVKVCVIAKSQTRYTHQVEIYKGISNTARYPKGCIFIIGKPSTNMNLTTYKKFTSVTASDFK